MQLAHLLASCDRKASGSNLDEVSDCSFSLPGNFYARCTKERHYKILIENYKNLLHMADKDFGATEILVGNGAVDHIKKLSETQIS